MLVGLGYRHVDRSSPGTRDLSSGTGATCDGDANGDGMVGIMDLLDVLDAFGTYCE